MPRGSRAIVLAAALAVAVGFPSTGRPQGIAPFRLIGIDGDLSSRFLFEDDTIRRISAPEQTRRSHVAFEEEFQLVTHSYIYHPNFLSLDLGGGPLYADESFDFDGRETSGRDVFYRATGRLRLLPSKPYPLLLFYDRTVPRVPLGLAERLLLTESRYGFNFSLLEPLVPVAVNLEGARETREGDGFSQVTDEVGDRLTLRANKFVPGRGDGSLVYTFHRQESATGDPELPIQETKTTTHAADLYASALFGSREQVRVGNAVSFFSQIEFPERRDLRVNPDLRWTPYESLALFSSYNLGLSSVQGVDTTTQAGRVGFDHRLYQSLFTGAEAHGTESETAGLTDRTWGGAGRVLYQKKVPFGGVALNYGAAYDIKDRRAGATRTQVFGESLVLTDFVLAPLASENVVSSTVSVHNATRSRTFTEGVDYRLVVVGVRTSVARLLGGAIVSGETVLVDYAFELTGTSTLAILDQTYGASLNLFSYVSLFARFRDARQRLLSGVSTQPLNSVRSQLYGAEARVPLRRFVVGGNAEYEDQEETIAPFRRMSYSASLEGPITRSAAVVVTGRRHLVDNLRSVEDLDITGASVRLEYRGWLGARLSAEASYDEDAGGTLKRETWIGTLLAEWRFRNILFRGEGRWSRDRQGDFERDASVVKLEIRREF